MDKTDKQMRVLWGKDGQGPGPCVAVLGFFDGLHIGHRALVERAQQLGQALGLPTVLHTFSELDKGSGRLTLLPQKLDILAQWGLDAVLIDEMDEAYRSQSAQQFFDGVLRGRLQARALVCGFHYRFGHRAAGDATLLAQLCAQAGIEILVQPPVEADGALVSATRVRALLQSGEIGCANALLGRPYALFGRVRHDRGLGRTLGFPTLNFSPQPGAALPRFGVYLSRARVAGRPIFAMSNIGLRPTVSQQDEAVIETHLLDFEGDCYGLDVRVELLEFLRGEQRFDSVERLRAQLVTDKQKAHELAAKYHK